jgi:peroxiredoxin
MRTGDLYSLREGLPVPEDDGAAAHFTGMRLPSVALPATDGSQVELTSLHGRVVVFAYPRTGRPGEQPLAADWDLIPGARGCTPQTCAFRDLHAEFSRLGCRVFALSTQDTPYQQELVERLHLPFPVLSDAELHLTRALKLPTMQVAGHTLLKRLAWVADAGVIRKVFYPVFPPNRNADEVLDWLRARPAAFKA